MFDYYTRGPSCNPSLNVSLRRKAWEFLKIYMKGSVEAMKKPNQSPTKHLDKGSIGQRLCKVHRNWYKSARSANSTPSFLRHLERVSQQYEALGPFSSKG